VNTLTALILFLLGSFAVIIGAISTPFLQYYTGGIVIALFIGGLFLAWGLTIIQTKKIAASDTSSPGQHQESVPEQDTHPETLQAAQQPEKKEEEQQQQASLPPPQS
jgi:Co/Zn/Cd efflux system component